MPSDRKLSPGSAVFVVATAGIAYLFVILVQLPGASRRGDFSIYYACAVAMHRGLDPYAINLTEFTRELGLEPDPFAHPADSPTFTLVTTPLAMVSASTAYAIWFIASTLCLIASLYLLLGALDRKTALLLSLAALAFTPLADNLRWAQSQVFAMFGVLLFLRLLHRGRDSAAAALLAALGLLRGFPLVLGGYLVARRRWHATFVLAIAFAAGAIATIAAVGIAPVANFLRIIGVVGGHQWFSLELRWEIAAANLSLDAFVARLGLGRGIAVIAKLVILATTLRATVNQKDDSDGRSASLWIVTMLILTPVVWLHYLTLLLIPYGTIAVASLNHKTGAGVWRFAIVSYCVVVLATPVLSTLTFRADISAWQVSAVAECGFLVLMSAWYAAYRFATEVVLEASDTEGRRPAALRS